MNKAWFPYDRHDRRDRKKWPRPQKNGRDDPGDHISGNTNFLFSDDRDDQDRHNRGDRN